MINYLIILISLFISLFEQHPCSCLVFYTLKPQNIIYSLFLIIKVVLSLSVFRSIVTLLQTTWCVRETTLCKCFNTITH